MRITVEAPNIANLRRTLRDLGPKGKRAAARAANDGARTARKVLSQEISRVYVIKSKEVKRAIDLRKATADRPQAVVKINHYGRYKLPMTAHKVTPAKPWNPAMSVKPRRRKYQVQVKREGGKKVFAGGFIAQMDSGHVGFFVRKDDAKHKLNPKALGANPSVRNTMTELGIEQKYSQAIAEMAGRADIAAKVTREAGETLQRRLLHEINRALGGH